MKRVSTIIIDKILHDNDFCMDLAKKLELQQQSVIGLAKRNSDKLTLYEAILFYKSKGFVESEIFENYSHEYESDVR